MTFELAPLPYSYDALEPYFDKQTMEIHHSKHHKAYTDKLNAALEKLPEIAKKSAEEILSNLNSIPEDIRQTVINNGGGYVNHNFFWQILKKDTRPKGEVIEAINAKFGSLDEFKKLFTEAATTQFGSGWAWLVIDENGELEILQSKNQDSPISYRKKPLLALDVWEHAYYLKYQNRRPDYIATFWNVVNWEKVNQLFEAAKS